RPMRAGRPAGRTAAEPGVGTSTWVASATCGPSFDELDAGCRPAVFAWVAGAGAGRRSPADGAGMRRPLWEAGNAPTYTDILHDKQFVVKWLAPDRPWGRVRKRAGQGWAQGARPRGHRAAQARASASGARSR